MKGKAVLKTLIDVGDWWDDHKELIMFDGSEESEDFQKKQGYYGVSPDELDFVDEAIYELSGKYRDQHHMLRHVAENRERIKKAADPVFLRDAVQMLLSCHKKNIDNDEFQYLKKDIEQFDEYQAILNTHILNIKKEPSS